MTYDKQTPMGWRSGTPPSGDSAMRIDALVAHRESLRIGDRKFIDRMCTVKSHSQPLCADDVTYLDQLYFMVVERIQFNGGCYSTPLEPCPYCGNICDADWVDVGVGLVQCGPYHCDCGASEIGPHDDSRELAADEETTGWYAPGQPPGSSANVVNGEIVDWQTAQSVYVANYPFSATDTGRSILRGT